MTLQELRPKNVKQLQREVPLVVVAVEEDEDEVEVLEVVLARREVRRESNTPCHSRSPQTVISFHSQIN